MVSSYLVLLTLALPFVYAQMDQARTDLNSRQVQLTCHVQNPLTLTTEPDWIQACLHVSTSEDFIHWVGPDGRSKATPANRHKPVSRQTRRIRRFAIKAHLSEQTDATDTERQSYDLNINRPSEMNTRPTSFVRFRRRPLSPKPRLCVSNGIYSERQVLGLNQMMPNELTTKTPQLITSGANHSALNAIIAVQRFRAMADVLEMVLSVHNLKLRNYLMKLQNSKELELSHEFWMPNQSQVFLVDQRNATKLTKQKASRAISDFVEYLQYFALALEQMDYESYKIVDECKSITPEKAYGVRLLRMITLKTICRAQSLAHFLDKLERDTDGFSQKSLQDLRRNFPRLQIFLDGIHTSSPFMTYGDLIRPTQVTRSLMPSSRRSLEHVFAWLRDLGILTEYRRATFLIKTLADHIVVEN